MVPKLPKRLQVIAELVEQGSTVADVGTDHGYLPAYLINTSKVPLVYAGDIVRGPLNSAALTMEKYGVPHQKVHLLLSDGLQSFPKGCASCIIIAGMGYGSIKDILESCNWIKSDKVKLILQPQNHHETMREYLYQSGFGIEKEVAVEEQGHMYTVMQAVYTGEKKTIDRVFAYCGRILDSVSEDQTAYIRHQISRLNKQKQGLMQSSSQEDRSKVHELEILTDGISLELKKIEMCE